jgi:hypothetical protein
VKQRLAREVGHLLAQFPETGLNSMPLLWWWMTVLDTRLPS